MSNNAINFKFQDWPHSPYITAKRSKLAYYAHCMSIYDTKQEERDVDTLQSLGFEVDNPNHFRHQDNWKTYGMSYADALVFNADVVAFRALPDGRISSGVAYELRKAKEYGKTIIELPNSILSREMTIEQTREYLSEVGQR
jgi:hypothetical protein